MKVKKKWKRYVHQITLACLLICSIVSFFPNNVFADVSPDHPKFKRYFSKTYGIDGKGNFQYNYTFKNFNGKSTVFQFRVFDSSSGKLVEVMYVSASSFTYDVDAYDTEDGKTGHGTGESSGCTHETINGEIKPVYFFDKFYYCSPSDISVSGACYDITNKTGYMDSIARFLYEDEQIPEEITCSSEGGEGDEGGIDNPIFDSDIGTLILKKSKMYEESNGEDISDLYNLWSWKKKTNTGFSLTKNKYAQTFLQIKVESKCVVYKDKRHREIYKKFDNYGEKAMLYDCISPDKMPLKISYLTDIPKVLPKTHSETHNPVYVGYNYTLYWRVVCTDDLSVIPGSGSNSKWHCGGWRSCDCNADILVEQPNKTDNGHFDENDNWVSDEDDGNNQIDSGSDTVHDDDEAYDNFNKNDDNNESFDWNSFKGLINQCKEVPGLIKSVFSFLPDWVLVFVALAFGIWLFVLIKRAIV